MKKPSKRYRWANAPGLVDRNSSPPPDSPTWLISGSYFDPNADTSNSDANSSEGDLDDNKPETDPDDDYYPDPNKPIARHSDPIHRTYQTCFRSRSSRTSRAATADVKSGARPFFTGKNNNAISLIIIKQD